MADKDKQNIRAEVMAAKAELSAAVARSRPVITKVKTPVQPEPHWADNKRVAQAFNKEQYGEADLIKFFFAGLVVRDNLASSPSKSIFDDVYEWTGAVWQRDTDHSFKAGLDIVGQTFNLQAWKFYDEAAKFLPQLDPPEPPDTTNHSVDEHEMVKPELSEVPSPPVDGEEPTKYSLARLKARAKDKELATPELQNLVKKGDEYMSRAKKCWTLPRQTQAANLACSGKGSLGFSGKWNSHTKLLPCQNGTLDIETGELLEPRPEHYFNKIVPWDYLGPDVPCPMWTDLLTKCLGHDQELLNYFELVLGSCLLGLAPKNIFVAYGPEANNGKSTIFGILAKLLGEFAVSIGPELLLAQPIRNSDAPRPGLLRLQSARAAFLKEAKSTDWFDLGQAKGLTGGDEQSERTLNTPLYRDFQIEATIVLHSNHLPRVAGLDRGFQNRLVIIPFLAQFLLQAELAEAEAKGKKNIYLAQPREIIDECLKKEMSGILGRLAASAQVLLALGGRLPPPPPICRKYAEEYLLDHDLPGQFIEECCIQGAQYFATFKKLFKAYKEWCVSTRDMEPKDKKINQTILGNALRVRFTKNRSSEGVYYEGLDLKDEFPWLKEGD